MYQTSELLVDANRRRFRCCIQMRAQHTEWGGEKESLKTTTESRIQNWDILERVEVLLLFFTLFLLPNLRDAASPKHLPCWQKQTLLQTFQRVLFWMEPITPQGLMCDTKLGAPLLLCLNDRVITGRLLLKKQNMELENSPGQGWRDGVKVRPWQLQRSCC